MLRRLGNILSFVFITSCYAYGQDGFGDRVVRVADINGQALFLVKPAFPEIPESVGTDGIRVSVMVLINEAGDVIHAECLQTATVLKAPAESAARTSKFKPLIVNGLAAKYWGFLIYTYVMDRVDWYRFGRYLETTRRSDSISFGPTADILSSRFTSEKARLSALDSPGVDYEARQKGLADVEGMIRSKISGADLWRFELGMVLRRSALWIDRRDLRSTLDGLATVIESAPADTSNGLIDDLTTLSKYTISPEITDRVLREQISKLILKIPQDPR